MRIRVLRERCVGAGQCVLRAPSLFDQSEDDGMVVVLAQTPSSEDERAAIAALGACPSGTIRLDP
ncbi:ferredoxin [Asanoa siamensis]|uniref:ferredoxin n=1 Tax=Asanoa siamensis TaxID=926357 RepID=UPI0019407A5F|nr:ferredoxin [Asanoa siamensis]